MHVYAMQCIVFMHIAHSQTHTCTSNEEKWDRVKERKSNKMVNEKMNEEPSRYPRNTMSEFIDVKNTHTKFQMTK